METNRKFLKKTDKIRTKKEFEILKEYGEVVKDAYFTMLVLRQGKQEIEVTHPKIGVICSRKFHHGAVVRNRARRLIAESFRLNQNRIMPCMLLFIPKKTIIGKKQDSVTPHILNALERGKCLQQSSLLPFGNVI